jgi:hypothetical protein
MNIRTLSLSLGIALTGLSAIPVSAFAQTAYRGNYGAGYLPSPVLNQETAPLYTRYSTSYPGNNYETNYPIPYPTTYGKGFADSPTLVPGNGSNLIISTSNYGAGFSGSPQVYGSQTTNVVYTANYGSGFVGSPALQGANLTPTVSTSNYGSGFVGSPDLIYFNAPLRYGHYGAGFMVSPAPWYGYGWFRW